MAGTITDYTKHAVLNYTLRAVALPTLPASIYAGLFTAHATDSSGGTEVTGGSYARDAITRGTSQWGAPATNGANRQVQLAEDLVFPNATANWGTVIGVGFFDASSGGNLLFYMELDNPRAINSGEVAPTIPSTLVTAAIGGHASNYFRDAILNWVFRGVAFPTLAAAIHAALNSTLPTASAAGTEFTIGTGAYARVAITRATGAFDAPSGGATQNASAITWPGPTTAWGTYVAASMMDAATAGNVLFWMPVDTSRAIAANDNAPSIAIGAWDIVLT